MINLHFMKAFIPIRIALVVLAGFWLAGMPVRAQHAHIYAGAIGTGPGQPLWFENGALWDTNSWGGYGQSPACIYMDDNIPDLYPGLFQTAITFTAEPATIFNGGPSPHAAALGSYIQLRFVSLEGPTGGSLTVWNEIDDPAVPSVMLSVPVGTTQGTDMFNLSEGDPTDPSADPYGHIHGRRLTLSKPGLYVVGLQIVDTSSNGPDGGPIQSPSDITYFYLQAGLYLSNLSWTNYVATARFGLRGLTDYIFESSPTVDGTNWVTVEKVIGTSHSELRWVVDTNATAPVRFYRIRPATN